MRIVLMSILVMLSSCAKQQAGHTANMAEALVQVEHGRVLRGIAEFYKNKSRVPIPYEIQSGSATMNDGVVTGPNPNIAFIGRGVFPGWRLEGNLDFQRTFSITPFLGLSERLRAHVLFQYAICNRPPVTSCDFEELLRKFTQIGSVAPTGDQAERSDGLAGNCSTGCEDGLPL
jgi:hypothetical protein